jgi:YbbR domain-containing protein
MIINNNRITKFSTHLPLSNNFKELGKLGTRHSAALGLTENSDCMCLVVSEERGKISICKDGKLKPLSEFSDLEKELDKFIKSRFDPPTKRPLWRLITRDWGLKTAALASAAILWFLIAYRTEILSKTFAIPVTFSQLPQDVLIETYSPKEIEVTVVGRGNLAFTGIDINDFKIDLDTSSLANGPNNFTITPQSVKQPMNLTIVSIEPQTVLLTAKKHYSASVNVEVKTIGELQNGYTVSEISVTPKQVDLWIPQGLPVPPSILTEAVDLTGKTESFVSQATLIIPPTLKLQKPDISTVSIAVTISL